MRLLGSLLRRARAGRGAEPDDGASVHVVCAWCRAEGRPGWIAPKPAVDVPTEAHGICGPHHLELLLKTGSSGQSQRPDAGAEFLVIVAKHERQELTRVSERCLHDPRFRVVMDRREGERRRGSGALPIERRRSDRRRSLPYWKDLRYQRLVVIPLAQPAIPSSTTTPTPVVSTLDRNRLDHWVREGHEVVGRLIPVVLDECRAQQQRVEAAEQRARLLGQMVGDLQGEVTTQRAEIDELRRLGSRMAECLEHGLKELRRLADALSR